MGCRGIFRVGGVLAGSAGMEAAGVEVDSGIKRQLQQLSNRRRIADQMCGPPLRCVDDLAGVDAQLGVDRGDKILW